MNTLNTQPPQTEGIKVYRTAAINGLAVVGLIALIGLGVWGGVYSSRYVPNVANGIGSAAVYMGSLFVPAPVATSTLTVVPTASSTVISFGTPIEVATSTPSTGLINSPQATTTVKKPGAIKPAPASAGVKTTRTVVVSGVAPAPYGLSDLAVTEITVGYLTTASTDSFVASTNVPSGMRPAIKFTVKNIGTNWSGTWRFSAALPTRTTFTYNSDAQQSLAAGDSIDYVLGFDRAKSGTQQQMVITINSDHTVNESSTANNVSTVYFNVL